MQQLKLLAHHNYHQEKNLSFEFVKAQFKNVGDAMHEVVLEINSHKFLIGIKAGLKKLEQFEIIAVKGFIDLGVKVVHFLKRLVTVLYFEY